MRRGLRAGHLGGASAQPSTNACLSLQGTCDAGGQCVRTGVVDQPCVPTEQLPPDIAVLEAAPVSAPVGCAAGTCDAITGQCTYGPYPSDVRSCVASNECCPGQFCRTSPGCVGEFCVVKNCGY